jgi:trk system potassium uptake protein
MTITHINFKIVAQVLSRNLIIISISLILCSILAIYYKERMLPFVYSSIIAGIIGIVLFYFSKKKIDDLLISKKDAYLAVTLSWFIISVIGALPYYFSQAIPAFIDSYFESVSGFTTTGSSILADIESLPKSILFWRSLTHWIGGIGIIVLVIIVMPKLKIGGYQLFSLESSLQEKITPKTRSVGYRLLIIYISLTVLEIIFLLLGKMNFFESVCHAFGTVATGGFSPKNTSIADYSPYIQYVIAIFMFLAGTNFIVHYYLIKGNFKKIAKNEEFFFYIFIVNFIAIIITLLLFFKTNRSFEEAFRESYFQLISIITCTGYATTDYLLWPQIAWLIIFFSMFIGGSTGSTAGGIKIVRHLILFKNIKRIFIQSTSPNAIIPIRLNKKVIEQDANNSILSFVLIYLAIFVIGTTLLAFLNVDLKTSASAIATSMAGIGPGIGTVGPASNFAHLSDIVKIILTFFMLLGRLEIFTILMLFSKNFWFKP